MTSTPPPSWNQGPHQGPHQGPPPQSYGGPPPTGPAGAAPMPFGGPPMGRPGLPAMPPRGAFDVSPGRVPVAAWLIPLAAILAVVGLFTPWFRSSIVRDGQTLQTLGNLYSWRDGRIGILPPVVMVVLSIGVVGLLRGRVAGRFNRGSSHPIVNAARAALIIGVVSALFLVIAWFEVPGNYQFNGPYGRDSTSTYLGRLSANGHTASLQHGPQTGFYLTAIAAALAIVGGVLMLIMRDKSADRPSSFANGGWAGYPPPVPAGPSPAAGMPAGVPAPGPVGGYGGAYGSVPQDAGPPLEPGPIPYTPPAGLFGGSSVPAAEPAAPAGSSGWSSPTGSSSGAEHGAEHGDEPSGRVDLSK